jgi:hypothetical protein
MEAEHVFPASWYPDTTPPTVQRLTVPSCPACNDRWERIERELGHELLMVLSPNHPEIAGVHARLSRAWQVGAAKNARDARHRAGKALKILRSMVWVEPVRGQPQATLRTPAGLYVRRSPARKIQKPLMRAVCEKLIRGLHYAETGEVLRELEVQTMVATSERIAARELAEVWSFLQTLPINQRLGPGLWYRHHDEPKMAVWAFFLWGQVTIVAFASGFGAISRAS